MYYTISTYLQLEVHSVSVDLRMYAALPKCTPTRLTRYRVKHQYRNVIPTYLVLIHAQRDILQ